MYDRMHELTREEIQKIHDASMELLKNTGMGFNEPEALEIFKQHGKKVDGKVVFLQEADVVKALETAPSQFLIHARNPEKDVAVGEDDFVFAPGYGARFGQPCVIAPLVIAGASGPVTMAGVLALQNAEILAGITLAQLVNPGNPIVYGATSAPMDMMSGAPSIGAPELSQLVSTTAQIARFYGLPSRSGGSLTDAQFPDIQAGIESALALSTAVRSGINFILHSCGILGSFIAMSFEKFIVDEELCGMIKKLVKPVEVTDDAIGLDIIKEVGMGGQYLTHDKTFERCRTEYFLPRIAIRQTYDRWTETGMLRADQRATKVVQERLESYQKPDIDPSTERALFDYVSRRKRM